MFLPTRILTVAILASLATVPVFAFAGESGHGHAEADIGSPAKASAANRTVRIEMRDTDLPPAERTPG